MKKSIITLLLSSVFLFSFVVPALAMEQAPNIAKDASAAILVEQDTGEVLYDKNSDKKLPPASMTKIMTMLIIMESVQKGKIKLTDVVNTSEHAAEMGGSQIFLEPGEKMTVHEMLKGIAVASGNDASVAMAEHIAGSEEAFVQKMNEKATKLGLKSTHFANPTGLPAENHYSSAKDMSIMARELLKYPLITQYTGIYEDYLRQNTDKRFWLVNTNKLVKFYPGVDGLKTGFTQEARYCLTATAKRNGMRVVAVVMGAPTPKMRNAQVTNMLDYAFNQYKLNAILKAGDKVGQVKISKGTAKKADVVVKDNVSIVLKTGESLKKMKHDVQLKEKIAAPTKKGDVVGKIIVTHKGKVVSTSPVVVKENVKKASLLQLWQRTMGYMTLSNQ